MFQSIRKLSAHVNKPKAFVASESYHMITATNVCVSRMATRLKGEAQEPEADVWRVWSMGHFCIALSRLIISAVVIIRDIVVEKFCVWITTQRLANVRIFHASFQMKFEKGLK